MLPQVPFIVRVFSVALLSPNQPRRRCPHARPPARTCTHARTNYDANMIYTAPLSQRTSKVVPPLQQLSNRNLMWSSKPPLTNACNRLATHVPPPSIVTIHCSIIRVRATYFSSIDSFAYCHLFRTVNATHHTQTILPPPVWSSKRNLVWRTLSTSMIFSVPIPAMANTKLNRSQGWECRTF